MSCGLKLRMNTTVPSISGGMLVAIDWPNMWLSGSRLRNRIGWNGRAYFLYLSISLATGTMFARMLRWRMTTPLGSAVAPDVNTICAMSSRSIGTSGTGPSADQSRLGQLPCRRRVRGCAGVDVVAGEHEPGLDDVADAVGEFRGRAVVDRHGDRAEQLDAPVTCDPFGAVLAP